MPTATVFTSKETSAQLLEPALPELREFLARELSCGARALAPDEISIRVITATISAMIAPIEMEITAHKYSERVERADKICLSVRDFIKNQVSSAGDVRVWLILTELGHSWDE